MWNTIRLGILAVSLPTVVACLAQHSPQRDEPSKPPAANDPARREALAAAQRIGHGVNLGNMLEAPREGEWGQVVKEEYLELIQKAGFNSVRIPICWSAHAAPTPPYAIEPPFLERVDQVVGWAVKNNLTAIINIHHYAELNKDPSRERERFLALWTQIADHFRGAPDSVLFELLNEPGDRLGAQQVDSLYAEVLPLIRRTNPQRTIVMGGSDGNSATGLSRLHVPKGETNVIGTFHVYFPYEFTHSGADWGAGRRPIAGAGWGGSTDQQQSLDKQFDPARRWNEETGLPIHLGEFGAYSKAEAQSRVRWTRHVVDYANAHQIPWSYWEFSSGFGVYDPDAKQYRKDLLDALIH
jgi:endoglucanase